MSLGLIFLHATSFYFVFMFLPVFLNQLRHLTESAALINNTLFLLLHLFLIPSIAVLAHKLGGKKSLLYIAGIFVLLSIPLFSFLAYGSEKLVIYSLLLFSIMTAANAAIIPGLLTEITQPNVRYTLFGLAFNLGFGIFGGIAPLFGLFLAQKTGYLFLPGIYLCLSACVTFIAGYLLTKEY